MVACPFNVPRVHWEKVLPLIKKCTFCADRQENGMEPACVKACPTDALVYGERSELIAEAESRIRNRPGKYVNHIYGKEEAGGTSWMYLSPVPFQDLGFPDLGPEPVPELSEGLAVYGTPSMLVGVTAVLGGLYWFTKRRAEGMAKQGKEE
jgi:formate dehydrogenase iron-sulfur subunit